MLRFFDLGILLLSSLLSCVEESEISSDVPYEIAASCFNPKKIYRLECVRAPFSLNLPNLEFT